MDRAAITQSLVSRLIEDQFPQWAHLPVTAVEVDGWDNRTFRLGDEMCVRLPAADAYVAQVDKEHRWLPQLAVDLPVAVPVPLAKGAPGSAFPRPWSVYRWLSGVPAHVADIECLERFALDLAEFLLALQGIDPSGGPWPGEHNFFRGAPLAIYDGQTREAMDAVQGRINVRAATEVWEAALASRCQSEPVWVHGDVTPSNLLVRSGQLGGVIDFGCCAVGDPACDLTIAWTLFTGQSRAAFRRAVGADDGTWARSRGWALWKGLITLRDSLRQPDERSSRDKRFGWCGTASQILEDVLDEHLRLG